MTPQERELLASFLQQLTQAQAGQKDAEAETLIREAAARQPDALYLLTQRALGLDHALQSMQAQVDKLQSELDQLRRPAPSSFLADPNAWGRSAAAPGPSAPSVPNADLAPLPPLGSNTLQRGGYPSMPPAPMQQPMPAMRPAAGSWGGAGILGTVATTAAGVVAGGLLYQGISSMMNHHDQAPVAAAPQPEPSQLASTDSSQYQPFDDSEDYSDSGSADFDSGDSA